MIVVVGCYDAGGALSTGFELRCDVDDVMLVEVDG